MQEEHLSQSLAEEQQDQDPNLNDNSAKSTSDESPGDCGGDIEMGFAGTDKRCDEAQQRQEHTHITIPCPSSNNDETAQDGDQDDKGGDGGSTRTVPASCAICLKEYKIHDEVSWCSTNANCPHVFHKECASQWFESLITKKGKGAKLECPMCRQEFLKVNVRDEERNWDFVKAHYGHNFALANMVMARQQDI